MNKKSSFLKNFIHLFAAILLNIFIVLGVLHIFSVKLNLNPYINVLIIIIAMIIVAAINTVIIFFSAKHRVLKPILRVTEMSENMAKGEFSDFSSYSDIDEIYQLELALSKLSEAIQKNDEMKNKFVSNISHELRTPLASISGFVDGIIDGTITAEQEPQYLKLISQEAKRLSRLTRLMLNLEQLESGAIKPEMIDVKIIDIIVNILNTFEKNIKEKNLEILGLDIGQAIIHADKDMIYQVFYNLIENAIKFTDKNGYIKFEFSEDADYNYVYVKNSGEGLSEAERKKVFNRFYKTRASKENDSVGAGLGLNIVHSIISLHGGTINVDSVLGDYTKFGFSIPKNKD